MSITRRVKTALPMDSSLPMDQSAKGAQLDRCRVTIEVNVSFADLVRQATERCAPTVVQATHPNLIRVTAIRVA